MYDDFVKMLIAANLYYLSNSNYYARGYQI